MVATGSLDGRVAVITGSTRSIGRAIAEAFLADGATVVISGRSELKGKQALEEMDAGDRAVFHPCDANSQEDIEGLADFAAERFGRLDIWVNNVGGTSGFAPIHELSDEAWNDALKLNLNAYFYGTRRALPKMLAGGWGRIINISSVEGKQANKPAISHYITNKHAIHGLTKATAFEYGTQGITCNAICPGAVDTDLMRAAGRRGRGRGHLVRGVAGPLRRARRHQADHHRGADRRCRLAARERRGRGHHRHADQRRRRNGAVVSEGTDGGRPIAMKHWITDWQRSDDCPTTPGPTRARPCRSRPVRWAGP